MISNKPTICVLPIEQLQRGRFQPRCYFDPQALEDLADSIKKNGLIQPIVVRPFNSSDLNDQIYEIIAGERRWRAAQLAGLDKITCLVNHYNDGQAAAVTTVENIQREDLNPIEEAQAIQRLINDFGYRHEEVAAIISSSRTKVTNLLRLLQLDERVKQFLIKGQISEGHGKMLAGLPLSRQITLANSVVKKNWSVRKLEQIIRMEGDESSPNNNKKKNPDITRLERLISEQMNTQVAVESEKTMKGGWLKIKFYDDPTLEGILRKIGIKDDDL